MDGKNTYFVEIPRYFLFIYKLLGRIFAEILIFTGDVIYPLLIDPKYTVDIDTLPDWAKYEALVYSGLEMVSPGKARRVIPEKVQMIVCDFDGVVTDNLAPARGPEARGPRRYWHGCHSGRWPSG